MIFVGIDGVVRLHKVLAEAQEADDEVLAGIETDRSYSWGPWRPQATR